MEIENLILIPCRGNSQGLPGKNVANLCGRPVVEWTILQALAAELSGAIWLLTDDQEAAVIGHRHPIHIIPEPADLAEGHVSMEQVMDFAANRCAAVQWHTPGVLIVLQPSSPLRLASHIGQAIQAVGIGGARSAVGCVPGHPFEWKRNGPTANPLWHQGLGPPRRELRQDIGARFIENGSVYAVRTRDFVSTRFIEPIRIVEMPAWTAPQIDTREDLELVRSILGARLLAGSDGVRT